ncbi:MAG: crossover junction endodeoxyribonuclease RuvC [Ferruginibacter sp.]
MQNTSKIILGIDPGTVVMGFGLINITNKNIEMIEMGVLKLNTKDDAFVRLERIHHKVIEIIVKFKPTAFAIEAPFFGKNVQSMLKLGRAQGVAIAAAIQSGLEVTEYSPKKIKQSITGNGNANKEQVMRMLQQLLKFTDTPALLDASDALAVAVCHHFQNNELLKTSPGKNKDWKDFIAQNTHRLKKI